MAGAEDAAHVGAIDLAVEPLSPLLTDMPEWLFSLAAMHGMPDRGVWVRHIKLGTC